MHFTTMCLTLGIILKLRPMVTRIQRHYRPLANHARRVSNSAPLNLGEEDRRRYLTPLSDAN